MPTFLQQFPAFGIPAEPQIPDATQMVVVNEHLAKELGIRAESLAVLPEFLQNLRDGSLELICGTAMNFQAQEPYAMAYSGHQFGSFNPRMGDGRAHLVAELFSPLEKLVDLHLKGSGRTPFSRPGADGKAPLSAMLREWVIGEALHGLGIPTSRILAVYTTGEYVTPRPTVMGNLPLPGGIAIRVADSHLRVGTFEYARLNLEYEERLRLAEYVLKRHYGANTTFGNPALSLLQAVANSQAKLVAQWMGAGFVHGVMNTDNVALSGQSIDFGPCAFLDTYNPNAVFSSIDEQGRYRYQNQPGIMQWNLLAFANSLVDLIDPEDPNAAIGAAQGVLDSFAATYEKYFQQVFASKLGDPSLSLKEIQNHLAELEQSDEDFTSHFRQLNPEDNSLYIPRNWKLEELLQAVNRVPLAQIQAGHPEFHTLQQLVQAVSEPFTELPEFSQFAVPPAISQDFTSFCGT